MDIPAECEAYEVVKDLVNSGKIQYYSQLKDITGYDNDLLARICWELHNEGHIPYFIVIKKLEY